MNNYNYLTMMILGKHRADYSETTSLINIRKRESYCHCRSGPGGYLYQHSGCGDILQGYGPVGAGGALKYDERNAILDTTDEGRLWERLYAKTYPTA